jgi:flavorubredoxin
MPLMGSFLTYMKGLKPKNKVGFAFGCYGWNNQTFKELEAVMTDLAWKIPVPAVSYNWRPTKEQLSSLKDVVDAIIKE